DEANRLALRDLEVDAVHRHDDAARRAVSDARPAHLEDRRRLGLHGSTSRTDDSVPATAPAWPTTPIAVVGVRPMRRRSGLMMSFRPSPTSVRPVTSSTIATPGNSAVHQTP